MKKRVMPNRGRIFRGLKARTVPYSREEELRLLNETLARGQVKKLPYVDVKPGVEKELWARFKKGGAE